MFHSILRMVPKKKTFWVIAVAGVPLGYLGLWTKSPVLTWTGIVLACPLYVVVLPFCLWLLLATTTWPFWSPFYLFLARRNGAPYEVGEFVRIVSGPYRGKVGRVSFVPREHEFRLFVSVDIIEDGKKTGSDFVRLLQLRRLEAICEEEGDNDGTQFGSESCGKRNR
jgi:hypothetical protein